MSTPTSLTLPAVRTSQFQPISGGYPSQPSATAPLPTRITRYRMTADEVPVDFFADPDGSWEFSPLVEMAGFNPEHPGASVGALTRPFDGFPEGSAVITEVGVGCRYVAIAQLPARDTEEATQRGQRRSRQGKSRPSHRRPHRAA